MIQSKYCQAPCSVKRYKLLVCDNDGSLCEIKPTNTLWYLLYVKDPPCNNRMAKLFRFRFCLPYNEFMTLVSELKGHDFFRDGVIMTALGFSHLVFTYLPLVLCNTLEEVSHLMTFKKQQLSPRKLIGYL